MVEIDLYDLVDMMYWSRRYCDGRSTYAPSDFNIKYRKFLLLYGEKNDRAYGGKALIGDHHDHVLTHDGRYWPFAVDGDYNPDTGEFGYGLPNIEDKHYQL